MLNPTIFHRPMKARVGINSDGDDRNPCSAKPSDVSIAFTGPRRGCRMNCQTAAMATNVAVTGRKYTTS